MPLNNDPDEYGFIFRPYWRKYDKVGTEEFILSRYLLSCKYMLLDVSKL